jgi:spermidine/putrescine transport system permease protein
MSRSRLARALAAAYLALIYAFFYVPLGLVFCYSFNYSKYVSDWNGFSLRWYEALFHNASLLDAALNSLLVAVCAASLGTLTGTVTALAIQRYRFFGRKALHAAVLMLTVLPDLVMGIALLIMFIAVHMELGFLTLLLAHTAMCAPFVTVTVRARLVEFDEYLIEAARDLGASEGGAFRHVLLPLAAPAVAAGWLLSFTLSMDDVLISTFTTGPTFEVLPVKIYSMVKLGVKPDINALSSIMFVMTLALVFSAHAITRIRRKQ